MNIITKYHGQREYEEKDLLLFKNGLPGFESLRTFILFPVEEGEVFQILHSIENEETGFVVTSPFLVDTNYEIKLTENQVKDLEIEKEEDVLVLCTVTLDSKVENITVNLKAPIVVNVVKGIGEQVIMDDGEYAIKHPLIQR